MNYKKIGNLACKIISINILVKMVSILPSVFYSISFNKQSPELQSINFFYSILPIFLLLVVGIALWAFSEKIGNIMIKSDEQDDITTIDYNKVQSIAFSVVGVYLTAISLPEILRNVIIIYQQNSIGIASTTGLTTQYTEIFRDIALIIIGLFLIFESGGLSNLINKIRKLD